MFCIRKRRSVWILPLTSVLSSSARAEGSAARREQRAMPRGSALRGKVIVECLEAGALQAPAPRSDDRGGPAYSPRLLFEKTSSEIAGFTCTAVRTSFVQCPPLV